MTTEFLSRFTRRLLPGERVQWSGQPGQGLLFTPNDTLLIPFSLLWGGFAIVWETMVLKSRAPGFMALFGIPFVAVGLYFIVGRFLFDAWVRRRIFYAVTDRRLLILREAPWSSFTAIQLDRLPDATMTERADGRGTIRFGPSMNFSSVSRGGFGALTPSLDPTPQMLAIEDVQNVFALIQRQSQGSYPPSAPRS